MLWRDGDRPERRTVNRINRCRAVGDMGNDVTVERCHQRHQHGAIGSQRVDDVGFLILPEGAPVHAADGEKVTRPFGPYLTCSGSHPVVESKPGCYESVT